jgi:hypothetical protein
MTLALLWKIIRFAEDENVTLSNEEPPTITKSEEKPPISPIIPELKNEVKIIFHYF